MPTAARKQILLRRAGMDPKLYEAMQIALRAWIRAGEQLDSLPPEAILPHKVAKARLLTGKAVDLGLLE